MEIYVMSRSEKISWKIRYLSIIYKKEFFHSKPDNQLQIALYYKNA